MTEALTDPQAAAMIAGLRSYVIKAAVERFIDAAIKPKPRFYRVREAAFGTASYETLLRSRGPIGPLTREQAQSAIILAGWAMGIITRDANGNLVRV